MLYYYGWRHRPTFPHPGGPHRIRDGISWVSRRDRRSVCWPTTLFWPKYSSSVFGLSISARGLFIVSSVRADKPLDDFKVCWSDPEAWLSGPAGPGSASLGTLRFNPLLAAVCLPELDPLHSLWAETLLLLGWKNESTADDGVPAMEEVELATGLLTVAVGVTASPLMRDFFGGGSLSSFADRLLPSVSVFCRHTSRCPLIVAALKSLKQTGHCTESGAVGVISFAMLIPAKRFDLSSRDQTLL